VLTIVIRQPGQDPREFNHPAGPLVFGRSAGTGVTPHCRLADRYISKEHLRLTEIAPGRVLLENLSATNPVRIGQETIGVAQHAERALPVTVTLGETQVDIRMHEEERQASTLVEGEEGSTLPAGGRPAGAVLKTIQRTVYMGQMVDTEPFVLLRGELTPERLLTWFETVVAVQRAAAGSEEFFGQAARAVVDLVGLDRGLVLLRQGDDWDMVSQYGKAVPSNPPFSRGLLRTVLLRKKTTYRSRDENMQSGGAITDEVVAAPILDASEEVIGVLYGARDLRDSKGKGLGTVEAQVIQLLAAVVGTGLARQQQEAEATRSRVQFEQFFTPELAVHLQHNPRLLEPQDRELTVLFADMRGSSHLPEVLGPQVVYALTNDLLERITGCVRSHEGVVIDYTGDGLFAMWNAPADQPDHAARACRAALDMMVEVEEINTAWKDRLGGREVGLGVGLNTGRALVGNTGSKYKFKYGPRGHLVNVGARTESATRQLGMKILMTKATHNALAGSFATRRVSKVRVASIDETLDLYELHAESGTPDWQARRETYEAALALFEDKRFAEACRRIHPLLANTETQDDIPTLTLIARAVECLKNPPQEFDPAIRIGKG
jgi:adenylate cyclase